MSPDELRCEAQSVLHQLWVEQLIPFELVARKIDCLNDGEYVIRFYDSRLRSVTISWTDGDSFADLVRVAVLASVVRMDVPPSPSDLIEMLSVTTPTVTPEPAA